MRGATSMAPMTTAVDDCTSPSAAMAALNVSMTTKSVETRPPVSMRS